jgi:hypothetical protein
MKIGMNGAKNKATISVKDAIIKMGDKMEQYFNKIYLNKVIGIVERNPVNVVLGKTPLYNNRLEILVIYNDRMFPLFHAKFTKRNLKTLKTIYNDITDIKKYLFYKTISENINK